ncbi:sodium-dependent glucose transporter 1A-like isoform X2 [Varroa jacobsoni]|uniref:Major facilitator superfamily domain-containing protein 4A n=1 Tax=Varroa destructor TaxID=109461 RepID=A0A7M7KHX3_VARDE|nr:sodium-dependent glucose transporter 1A-like isoform X2 [Varroa destructor]XP_022698748.1 sodium-dependent glucose transporter 1A-like isoform X2 [Varroa jacobsoni]
MTNFLLLTRRQGERAIKYFQTMHLLMAGMTLGLVLVIVGPSLLDLADLLQVSVREMTLISFGGDFGAFFGSVLALMMFRYFSAQKVIISFMLLIGVSNILIPLGGTPVATAILTFCSGCGVGIVEIGAYVWLVGLWSSNVAPIVQLLQLSYGIGAFMSPLIAEPYLTHHPNEGEIDLTNATASLPLNVSGSESQANFVSTISPLLESDTGGVLSVHTSMVHIPYALVGIFALFNALFMIVSYFIDSKDVTPEKPAEDGEVGVRNASPRYQWTLVTFIGIYTLVAVALEVVVGKFLPAYAVHHYSLSRSAGARIVSLFYVGFTFGRMLAVPLSIKLSPMHMMNIAQAGILGSVTVLTFIDRDERVLWTCSFTLGACLSPMFGSATAWLLEQVALSHDYMSIIMTMVTFGALAPPLFVGLYIEAHPDVLMYAVLSAACTMIVACWTMYAIASIHKRVYAQCSVRDDQQDGRLCEQNELAEKLHQREIEV